MATVSELTGKQILYPTKSAGRWFAIDYQANLYQGCSYGCIYCESHDESTPVDSLDTVTAKPNALEPFSKELVGKNSGTIIGFGSVSDPYNPLESSLKLTRRALELLDAQKMGAVIVTKSDQVVNDIDLFKRIKQHSPLVVIMTITTYNEDIAKKLEPKAPLTAVRFKALQKLSNEGIKTGVLMMPIVPYINDTETNVIQIIRKAKEVGAGFVYPAFGISLRDHQRRYFYEMIDREFPGLKNIYMDIYGSKLSCQSPYAQKLKKAFVIECKKLKINYGMADIVKSISPATTVQLKLF